MLWNLSAWTGLGIALIASVVFVVLRLFGHKGKAKPKVPIVKELIPRPACSSGKRIGILIVAYNALTTLSAVLKRIPKDVWDNIEEVAVFDDHSPDETYELGLGVKTLHRLEKLTILRNEKNLGYGGNQKRGYRYFQEKGFDIVVMLHGDGQYAPEALAHLYTAIATGEADAVFGSRMMKDYGGPIKGGMPLYKYVGNKILTGYANIFLGMQLTEFHSGYRAYSLHALKKLNFDAMTDDFHFDTQIIIKLHHQGFRIKEVPIPTFYGNEICYVNGMKYARDVYLAVNRYRATIEGRATYPEYAEYASHSPHPENKFSSSYYIERFVGQQQDVLGVTQTANHGSHDNQAMSDDSIATDNHGRLSGAIPKLGGRRFDIVVLRDVLEHLSTPEELLHDCREVLKPHGRIALAVPNVANISVRLALLLGNFEYTQRGILAHHHLRFYTRRSIRRVLEEAGYDVLEQHSSVMPLGRIVGISPRNLVIRAANRMLAALTWVTPGLLGYDSIVVARPRQTQVKALRSPWSSAA